MTVSTAVSELLQAIVAAIEPAELFDRLVADPLDTVQSWPGVRFQFVENLSGEGTDLAGSYDAATRTIRVAKNENLGRQAFTALHELGHHLQQQMAALADLLDLLAGDDDMQELEERACDAFAARVLFPASQSAEVFSGGVTVSAVAELAGRSNASLAAVCVEATRWISGPGQVLILDDAGHVDFSSATNTYRAAPRSDQSSAEPIRRALEGRILVSGRGSLEYRDGIQGSEQYMQVGPVGRRFVAVVVGERPAWIDRFVLPTGADGPSAREWTCSHCGEDYASFDSGCTKCDQPPCPACGRCGCHAGATGDRRCPSCFMVHPPSMFAGDSEVCLDC